MEGVFPLFDARGALADKAGEMVDAYNSSPWRLGVLAGGVGPFAVVVIRSAIGKVLDSLPALDEHLAYALEHYAPVISLFDVSADWTTGAMTPLSEIAGAVGRDIDNTSLREWEDDARDVYSEDIVPHQLEAVRAAKDNTAYISNMLSKIGAANTRFAAGLIDIVADIYAQLVKIVSELATGVGAPFAIQDAAEVIADVIRAIAGRLTDVVNDFTDAVVLIRDAENELSDHEYFPNGRWPEAVRRA
jgi:hypothetical protein